MKTVSALLAGLILGAAIVALIPREPATAQPSQPTARDHKDKAWIGISYIADQWGGLEISQVHFGSPAWEAGLMKGDTIVGVEVLIDGKLQPEMTHGQTVPFFLSGLETAAPGTEFKVYVKRGAGSLATEKAFAVDFPREKIEIPAADVMIQHIRKKSEAWKQAEYVWMTIKSRSFNEFSEHALRAQQLEVARLQAVKLQEEVRNMDLQRAKLLAEIQNALAQRDLALAQTKAAEMQRLDSGFGVLQGVISLLGLFF